MSPSFPNTSLPSNGPLAHSVSAYGNFRGNVSPPPSPAFVLSPVSSSHSILQQQQQQQQQQRTHEPSGSPTLSHSSSYSSHYGSASYNEPYDHRFQYQVRRAFLDVFPFLLKGYRKCMFFMGDEGVPIFNKKAYLSMHVTAEANELNSSYKSHSLYLFEDSSSSESESQEESEDDIDYHASIDRPTWKK